MNSQRQTEAERLAETAALHRRVADLAAALADAGQRETATAEILRIISTSPTDLERVFESIVRSAARVCQAADATLSLVEGPEYRIAAHHGPIPLRAGLTRLPIGPGTAMGRSILEGRVVHIEDLSTAEDFAEGRALARELGQRATLCVPLLRDGAAIGTIMLRRTEARRFSDKQVELLQTFADQAIIAIENARLLTELREKNRAVTEAHGRVTEALEQQTATAEILRVIASSPTDVQPTLDAIAANAWRVCDAANAAVFRFDGELIHLAAHDNLSSEWLNAVRSVFPLPPGRGSVTARAILTRAVVHVPDIGADAEHVYRAFRVFGTSLSVPLLRDGLPLGAITVARTDVAPFSDSQIELLKTFADQAVIAIENVRLFTELREKNRAISEALERQTATAELLRVISRSQTELQPVFDAIADSAMRLLGAWTVIVCRFDGDLLHLAAARGGAGQPDPAVLSHFPTRPTSRLTVGRCILARSVIQIGDVETEAEPVVATREMAQARGWRSALAVPMLRNGQPIGAIMVTYSKPRAFGAGSVELLQTFADQAVIAIENARLFNELRERTAELTRSVRQLTALGEVGQAVSSSLDLETVLTTIVSRATQLAGTDGGAIYEYDEASEEFELRAEQGMEEELLQARRAARIRKGEGAVGRLAETREPVQIPDIAAAGAYQGPLRETLLRTGIRSLLAVPLLREDHLIGALVVNRKAPGEFAPEVVELLKTFATQSALAIQNARLFREIEAKGRQLEVASQHKSEFLANMSHELRTPMNAILGFSEILAEGMFGEINDKQAEYLRDILESGRHLLSLINDILDLSKIEAGRMELELTDFDLPTALDNALTLVRERAGRRGIALGRTIDEHVGMIRADERKVKQVVLNLLSNAIKFTPDGGRIEVRAGPVNGFVEVSVTDTGIGIAPEDQDAIFEEFRQVGTAAKKVEGTGLGLALSRKFVELQGGRISVKSEARQGSTFSFTIPVRSIA